MRPSFPWLMLEVPALGEAVIWQNPSAYRTAVAKIAGRGAESGSKRRQRDGVVAGYWQRYCSKNDTVGFFGPLAWGTIRDEGPAVAVRSRGLIAEREVHFESWCLEALAHALDPSLPAGGFQAPLIDLFFLPMFVAAMRTFAPFPEVGPRITIGRTVLRRATWRARASDRPTDSSGMTHWAAELGLPRRVFCLPAGEAKPVYVDFDSPALMRNLHRILARRAALDPNAPVRFTEMLPGPDECWLEHEHARYTSELRIVAVDLTRRGLGTVTTAA